MINSSWNCPSRGWEILRGKLTRNCPKLNHLRMLDVWPLCCHGDSVMSGWATFIGDRLKFSKQSKMINFNISVNCNRRNLTLSRVSYHLIETLCLDQQFWECWESKISRGIKFELGSKIEEKKCLFRSCLEREENGKKNLSSREVWNLRLPRTSKALRELIPLPWA